MGCHGVAVVGILRLAGERIVRKRVFAEGLVLHQVEYIVKLEISLATGRCEERDIVAMPAFIAHFQAVVPLDLCQNVAPVITMLDEIAERESVSEAGAKTV